MSRVRAPAAWWALACVLVLAQTLGLAHRVLHGATGGPPSAAHVAHAAHLLHVAPVASAESVAAAEPATSAKPSAAPAVLFDEHTPGSEQCRLLDQAAQADALVGGAALAPPLWPRGLPQAFVRAAAAGRATPAYQARGPPPAGAGPLRVVA